MRARRSKSWQQIPFKMVHLHCLLYQFFHLYQNRCRRPCGVRKYSIFLTIVMLHSRTRECFRRGVQAHCIASHELEIGLKMLWYSVVAAAHTHTHTTHNIQQYNIEYIIDFSCFLCSSSIQRIHRSTEMTALNQHTNWSSWIGGCEEKGWPSHNARQLKPREWMKGSTDYGFWIYILFGVVNLAVVDGGKYTIFVLGGEQHKIHQWHDMAREFDCSRGTYC